MKKVLTFSLFMVIAVCANTYVEAAIDLSTAGYDYDIAAGTADIIKISFDYNYGANQSTPAFRIRRLNDDNTDSWIGSFNIYSDSFNLDTDYGPYAKNNMSLAGTNHFDFVLNRSNGIWDLFLNNIKIDFVALATTNATQPNGDTVTAGAVVNNKFFSDESVQAGYNAIALGWANLEGTSLVGNAQDGVGGTGAYRIKFLTAAGTSVDNIQVTAIPEPATIAILALGGLILRKRS